jgi:acyl-coenzyme A synthetase/AMP-(fatty) acid ligase
MSGALPLLAGGDAGRVIAWRGGEPVSAAQFLADAAAQAAVLPASGPAVNLCGDRYRFAVGLAAALVRGHTSLLPPNALPDTLARLRSHEPSLYGLTDDPALRVPGMTLHRASEQAAVPGAGAAIPLVATGQPAVCLLTSGSTGLPQPHEKTWGTLGQNIGAASERLANLLERSSLTGLNVVATVPAQHSYGLESSVLLAMLGGAAFDAGRPFYPADIALALERLPRPRALVTTPFHLKTLLAAGLPLPPTDLVLCATAPLSPQLALAAERVFGGPLIEIYGCTEAGQVATRRTVATDEWQTFGALRITREGAGDDECFVVSGGHVAEPTVLADLLALVEPGQGERFRLLGRAGDVIHVAGKRSSLAHLNHHLNSIEGVLDGAFWLPPDVADGVVRPVAFVVAPALGAAHIVGELRRRLEPAFVPRRVIDVAALPREATGKLSAQALERFARAQLGAGKAAA